MHRHPTGRATQPFQRLMQLALQLRSSGQMQQAVVLLPVLPLVLQSSQQQARQL